MPRVLKPDKIKQIAETYKTNGNVSLTAKECGAHPKTVRNIVAKYRLEFMEELSPKTDTGIVERITESIQNVPDVRKKGFDELAKKLGGNNIIAILQDPKKFDATTREVARIAFMTILVEMLNAEKIKDASLNSLASVVPVLADAAGGKYSFMEIDSGGKINTEEIITKLQMSIKRIKGFNSPLSEEVKQAIDDFEKSSPKKVGKVLDAEVVNDNSNTVQNRQ